MKTNLKIIIGLSILILCLSITAISANENTTTISSKDNTTVLEQVFTDVPVSDYKNYTITAKDFKNNNRIKIDSSFKYVISEKDVEDAKNSPNYIVYKKAPNVKVKVLTPYKKTIKEKVYKTDTVKSVKKFVCWHLTKNSLKMDKNYLKNYYKYQAKGYKITGKWVKVGNSKKCICTATKTKKVKKWTGKYKTKKVTKYKPKILTGIKIEIWCDGVVFIYPDVKGYRTNTYTTGYGVPGLCTVGLGPYV